MPGTESAGGGGAAGFTASQYQPFGAGAPPSAAAGLFGAQPPAAAGFGAAAAAGSLFGAADTVCLSKGCKSTTIAISGIIVHGELKVYTKWYVPSPWSARRSTLHASLLPLVGACI